ncbi:hypothetical protein BXT86_02795 [candidate division WOR-3 bacterium 4484_100]|uniref:Uncharacterized protein n=1 Tax=candidate division WOR-3 bacterium 4484_100 TaxID=1936077 RepID=A0A1V4QGK4_UNCW3|nr:MAG: hypothetical protein BXT86_02795 [candidate division WOR-3 bacterium 4484_100]
MIPILWILFISVPEDSNAHYLMDKQLAPYLPEWEVRFDSTRYGLRTSQGCLDLLNWFIDLDIKYEVYLSKIIGLRYRHKYLGDYANHKNNHYFEPFFQLNPNLRLLLSITTHYYKGEDELGIGFFLGKNYLNYINISLSVPNFDRNFSLKNTPDGQDKVIYQQHPVKLELAINRYWNQGHLRLSAEATNRYYLHSTDEIESIRENGLHRTLYLRMWQGIKRFGLAILFDYKQSELNTVDIPFTTSDRWYEIIAEPSFSYRFNPAWKPTLYLTYNYKKDDMNFFRPDIGDSVFNYSRNIFAYYLDLEYRPGGRFIWHFGTQRQFYYNNQGRNTKERRLNLGFEYRYKKIWFYFMEAMEGDFPTEKYLHNHTYVQLLLKF